MAIGPDNRTIVFRAELLNLLNAKANDLATVHVAGDETINGVKTFNNLPISSVTPTAANQFTTKSYVDSAVSSGSIYYSPTNYMPMKANTVETRPWDTGTLSGTSLAVNTVRAIRFPIGRTCTITNIWFEVTTAVTSGAVDIVRYSRSASGDAATYVSTLVTNAAAATVGAKNITVSIPVVAGEDLILGLVGKGAAPTLRHALTFDPELKSQTPALNLSTQGWTGWSVTSSPYSTLGNNQLISTTVPRIALMAS